MVGCSSRAKNRHTADQSATVSGEEIFQLTGFAKLACGVELTAWATLSQRMVLLAGLLLISPYESPERSTDISMFDCPEHRNTSPTRMSWAVCVAPEEAF